MSRSGSSRGISVKHWLLALLIIGGVLVFLFSWSGRMSELRIAGSQGSDEIGFYARWCDLTTEGPVAAREEIFRIAVTEGPCLGEAMGAGWRDHLFAADGFADTVRIRRLRSEEGGWVIKFDREHPFRAQRHIVLIPADASSIRYKYLELLAHELGLVTPEISFVRVLACGRDLGIYMKEERIDIDFLEKQGLAGSALFTQGHDPTRPDHLYPAFEGDTLAGPALSRALELAYADLAHGNAGALPYIVDRQAGVAMLLMQWIEHGDAAFSGEQIFAYNWAKGRVIPIYRHARGSELPMDTVGPVSRDLLTGLLHDRPTREAFMERREKLIEERWRMKERFAAMDRAWLPILVGKGSLEHAVVASARIQEELIGARLDRADAGDRLQRDLVRWAGAQAFLGTDGTERYWPSQDDPHILQRLAERTKARVDADTLVFPRGRYMIDEDLTIPYGTPVVMEEGARFEIAAGRSVVVQGALFVRGTLRNPVFVRPQEEGRPFGSFAVIGDGTTRCVIRGLKLSGGSEARVNGVYCSGQLAVHNARSTEVSDCIISGSEGEDLLNIKDGQVLLRDCVFEDGHADLVDLDRCTGRVVGCVFRSGRKDSNGDGLDVSGARVYVESCSFTRMMDKGISVGEASQLLVRGSRFEGNRLALASKDLSIAYVDGNTFVENGIIFGAYRKKPIYGGARVVRSANEYEGNSRAEEVDALSAVVTQEKLDAKVLAAFEVD